MIIVTGGAGFIGSALVQRLNELGRQDIMVVDRLRDGKKWLNLRGFECDGYFHADDFLDSEFFDHFSGIDAVYHMGACSDTTQPDVDYLMKNNFEYSQEIFLKCRDRNIPFVYASSAATYGDGSLGYNDDHDITPNLRPLNAYGFSKQVFDEWVLRAKRHPDIWYGVKFFNVYGPNEYHKGKMSSVIYHSFNQIKETGKMKLFKSYNPDYKDGQQMRDFVYVKDVVEAMIQLVEKDKGQNSGLYNLGTGKARTFDDLVKATFSAMGKEENIEYIDMPENLKAQYQYYTQAKMEKLENALPDFKFHSLEEGVTDYVQNYLMQPIPYLEYRK